MKIICEELGDVLLQVLLHAQIAKEEGRFTMEDVVNTLAEKWCAGIPMYSEMKSTVLRNRTGFDGRR